MPVDPLLSLLVGAFGAAILGLIGAWIQSRREHRKWLRERRYEAYRAFMVDMDAFGDVAQTTPTLVDALSYVKRAKALQRGFAESYEAVSLLGPKKVNAAGQRWAWAGADFKKGDSAAAQKEWGDARWGFLIAAGKELKSRNVGPQQLVRPAPFGANPPPEPV
jgi:hypothetical protein